MLFQLHISELAHAQSPKEKEVDFFKEHTEDAAPTSAQTVTPASSDWNQETPSENSSRPVPIKNGNGSAKKVGKLIVSGIEIVALFLQYFLF